VNWLRKLLAHFGHAQVAKPAELPPQAVAHQREAREVLHDLRELKRFELIVRKR
jgi:hypothetical protein